MIVRKTGLCAPLVAAALLLCLGFYLFLTSLRGFWLCQIYCVEARYVVYFYLDVRIVYTSDPAFWINLLCKLDYFNHVCRTLSGVVS